MRVKDFRRVLLRETLVQSLYPSDLSDQKKIHAWKEKNMLNTVFFIFKIINHAHVDHMGRHYFEKFFLDRVTLEGFRPFLFVCMILKTTVTCTDAHSLMTFR